VVIGPITPSADWAVIHLGNGGNLGCGSGHEEFIAQIHFGAVYLALNDWDVQLFFD
jgi:hypothetical protein